MNQSEVAAYLLHISGQGNCIKRKVACVIVDVVGELLAEGANGTPTGVRDCDAGGCVRCASAARFEHGIGYDLCTCLHAEQAALTAALSNGRSVRNATLYTTYQPCIMCAKLIVASGISGVRYIEPWVVPEESSKLVGLSVEYALLWERLSHGCLEMTPVRT